MLAYTRFGKNITIATSVKAKNGRFPRKSSFCEEKIFFNPTPPTD